MHILLLGSDDTHLEKENEPGLGYIGKTTMIFAYQIQIIFVVSMGSRLYLLSIN